MTLTSALIRQRLQGSALPLNPTDITMSPGSSRWPEPMREQLSSTLKPAGVLVPIVERGDELSILLTKRSAELKHHAGQISFPGGRMEAYDVDVEAAALRETDEEVGIPPHRVSVIGYLDTMPTVTGYSVTPVVGMVDGDAELKVDKTEVEYAFEVPLAFLMDDHNAIRSVWESKQRKIPMLEFSFAGERIWGATAFMIINLKNIILNK